MEAVETRGERWPAIKRRILEGSQGLALAGVLGVLVRALVIEGFYIPSASMLPTLQPGDYVLVNRFVYRLHPPRRGDVIVFRYPQDERWDFVKRVIAVPGDVVKERNGHFWVNGAPLREPNVIPVANAAGPAPTVDFGRIPRRQFFVLGDNREASLDSRFWGTLGARQVTGDAFLIYWSRGKHWWDVRWGRIGRWIR